MTIIKSPATGRAIIITQGPSSHDELTIRAPLGGPILVKKADLRAALDEHDPQPEPLADWEKELLEGGTDPAYRRESRHLRHIEDLEATLARRNERHEQDQERIRELVAEVADLQGQVETVFEPKTPREYLEAAWEAAEVPEDGRVREGEGVIHRNHRGEITTIERWNTAPTSNPALRLLDPRPAEPTEEERVATELTEALEGQRVGMDIAKSIAERLAAQGWRKEAS